MTRVFIRIAAGLLMLLPVSAGATMPPLGDEPPTRDERSCRSWAAAQIRLPDVAYVWGLLDDGNHDPAVALTRLADYCLGKPLPDLVGVAGSAGMHGDYCRLHPAVTLCTKGYGGCVGNRALCEEICRAGGGC